MIFSSKNERGVPAWKMVMSGEKTRTRRLKPVPVGCLRAMQPKRCAKGLGFVHIQGCESHRDWMRWNKSCWSEPEGLRKALELEAHREGFETWDGLLAWFREHKINIDDTYVLSLYYLGER